MDDLLSLAEAAAELGLSTATLRAQVQDGRLAARLFGRTLVTTRAEVDRYQRESRGQADQPATALPRQKGEDATKTDMSAEGPDGQVYGG
jgi:excisionase family DNA binding protein